MKLSKRILATIMSVFMVITSANIMIAASTEPTITFSSVQGKKGDIVEVTLNVENNPGIICMTLVLEYDDTSLKLVEVTDAGIMPGAMHGDKYVSPYQVYWMDELATSNYEVNGTFVTLKFEILTDVIGEYEIKASVPRDGIMNFDFDNIDFALVDGKITVVDDHIHSMTYIASKEATCIETGTVEYWYCSDCQKYYSDEQGASEIANISVPVNTDNHKGDTEVKDTKNATCNADGYTGNTYCLDCGAKIAEGEVIPATGEHTGGEATCKEKAVCEVCGNEYGDLDADNHKGNTEVKDASNATCGEDGYTGDTYCLDCGIKLEEGEAIPATGNHTDANGDELCDVCKADLSCKHSGATEIRNIAEATCGEEGYTGDTYCLDCDGKIAEGEVIPATGDHIGGEATCSEKAICEVCDKEYGEFDADNHSGKTEIRNESNATCVGDGYTGDTYCEGCDEKLAEGETIPATGKHAGGEATCSAKAVCEGCGNEYGELDADNHKGETEVKNAVEATCVDDGYTGDTYCKDCGEMIADGEVLPATNEHTGDEATCIAKAICEVCGSEYGELDVNNHKGETEIRDVVEATCGDDGYTGDTYCMDCGEISVNGTVVSATGMHTDDDGDEFYDICGADLSCKHTGETEVKEAAEATCVEDGYTGDVYCKDCGEKIEVGEVIPATDEHIASGWIIDEEATETETGLRHKECVVCGLVLENEEIPVQDLDSDLDLWRWYMMQLINQKFTITAEAGEGGSITDEGKTTVKYNKDITYYITPDEGYAIEAVYVNGKDIGVTNEYTFENVKADQKISVTFAKTSWVNPFVDIADNAEYIDAIEFVYENGLFKGVSDIEFAPETTMTRAMFVTVLGRYAGVNTDAFDGSSFDDVIIGEWYAPYVEWAAENEIVLGYGDGTFGIDDKITVEQATVILARFAEYAEEYKESDISLDMYEDADKVADWAMEAMKWAVENGIYSGSDEKLNPQNPAPRALVAEMIYNYAKEFEIEK